MERIKVTISRESGDPIFPEAGAPKPMFLDDSCKFMVIKIANCESGLKGEGSKETEDVEGKKGAKKQPPEGRRKGLLK